MRGKARRPFRSLALQFRWDLTGLRPGLGAAKSSCFWPCHLVWTELALSYQFLYNMCPFSPDLTPKSCWIVSPQSPDSKLTSMWSCSNLPPHPGPCHFSLFLFQQQFGVILHRKTHCTVWKLEHISLHSCQFVLPFMTVSCLITVNVFYWSLSL